MCKPLFYCCVCSAIATRSDVGDDLDSAKTVQRNFDEFKATLRANEQSRVTRVVDTALALIADAHPEGESIDAKRKAIMAAWGDLQKHVSPSLQRCCHVAACCFGARIVWLYDSNTSVTGFV